MTSSGRSKKSAWSSVYTRYARVVFVSDEAIFRHFRFCYLNSLPRVRSVNEPPYPRVYLATSAHTVTCIGYQVHIPMIYIVRGLFDVPVRARSFLPNATSRFSWSFLLLARSGCGWRKTIYRFGHSTSTRVDHRETCPEPRGPDAQIHEPDVDPQSD